MNQLPALLIRLTPLLGMLACLAAGPAYGGTCSSPTGKEADIVYNADYHTYQFCNGTNWMAYRPGTTWLFQAANNPTIPAGSGFFVLTSGTYTGNLGGLSGANSTCLTELTTNTGWKGYSTANGNGQLISGKVKAFLCDGSSCNNLTASTTYFFANAGNSAAGGASFTTNSSGFGPGDNADWAAANYFGGTYFYWSMMGGTSSTTLWTGASAINNTNFACNTWSSSSSGSSGFFANSAATDYNRWDNNNNYPCNNTYHLICFVNP